jgi:hypothetical protein
VRRLIFIAGLIVFLAGAGAPVAPTAAASASGDTDPPQITLRTPGDGAYYRPDTHVVIVDFQCSDSGSGVASCVGTQPNGASLDTAQAGAHTFTVTAVDGTRAVAPSPIGSSGCQASPSHPRWTRRTTRLDSPCTPATPAQARSLR